MFLLSVLGGEDVVGRGRADEDDDDEDGLDVV